MAAPETTFATIARAQGMRYLMLAAWTLGLAALVGAGALIWLAGAVLIGLVRGEFDRRQARTGAVLSPFTYSALVLINASAWAVAPLWAVLEGGLGGWIYALAAVLTGMHIATRQFDRRPRMALLACSPYLPVLALLIASHWGRPEAWITLACVPMMAMGLISHVVYGRLEAAVVAAYEARQAQMIADLEAAQRRAEAADRAKSAFLAGVSHELRTPLNAILGASQLIESGRAPGRHPELAQGARRAAEILLGLVNDLIEATASDGDRIVLQPVETDLAALIDDWVGAWSEAAHAKGLSLAAHAAPGLPERIQVDAARLNQVVHKLLSNAVRYTASGEIRIEVSLKPGPRPLLDVTVRDTGLGLTAAQIGVIFTPFERFDSALRPGCEGTGLGLPIARRVAKALEGDIHIASTPGAGSAFSVVVPVEPLVAQGQTAAPGVSNVLVVEDNPANRRLLGALLGALGCQIDEACDGAEGVAAAEARPFDAILMDVNMPVMDGLQAIRAIRGGAGPNRNTPIVIVSAAARPEDEQEGLSAGANAYLTKPIHVEGLAATLAACAPGSPQATVQAVHSPLESRA
ncbi:response regulator [Brevundimonas sp. 2R-24]|uniref:histidine kinase n=1 Tax=Peiella sedimenti TaxID=3061083 RepID=A0ABT8SMQ4_9CAUL|nr:response regulator [Caulobacteraceae bacterium XZ-24]